MKNSPFIAIVAVFALLLASCHADSPQTNNVEVPSLQLSYKYNPDSSVSFTESDLGDGYAGTLDYVRVTDVMIKAGDTAVPLETALRDGTTTFHEIHYLAQKDAAAGICYETAESKRGLTRFSYDYLSYKLIVTDDIYETPDGKQHHIRDLTVTDTGTDTMLLLQHLDQEDWGIEFEIEDVNPSSITLNYTQSGGQLIGRLRTGDYQLSRIDIMQAIPPLDYTVFAEVHEIDHDGTGTFTLDFEGRFGVLESGDYLLYLYLHDVYEPEQVPPLVRNYHDMQCYTVEFSIP